MVALRGFEEASRYVPLDQLCLSPQCGFSSTVEGNELTIDDELAKLRLVVETAREVWGWRPCCVLGPRSSPRRCLRRSTDFGRRWHAYDPIEMTGSFDNDEARRIGEQIGIDWDTSPFDVDQFRIGMNVELEHGSQDPRTNVTNDDPITTGRIAWAHLNEFADYYTRLEAMEEQAKRELR